jgi:hypothetical protein
MATKSSLTSEARWPINGLRKGVLMVGGKDRYLDSEFLRLPFNEQRENSLMTMAMSRWAWLTIETSAFLLQE